MNNSFEIEKITGEKVTVRANLLVGMTFYIRNTFRFITGTLTLNEEMVIYKNKLYIQPIDVTETSSINFHHDKIVELRFGKDYDRKLIDQFRLAFSGVDIKGYTRDKNGSFFINTISISKLKGIDMGGVYTNIYGIPEMIISNISKYNPEFPLFPEYCLEECSIVVPESEYELALT